MPGIQHLILRFFGVTFPLFLFAHVVMGQNKKDTLVLHLEKYPNGKISAYSYLLQSTGDGSAVCYDPKGKIMFQSGISRNHGHHSVHFKHHPNKVVSHIEESSAPDGGIQWYRTYYSFNEKGELIQKREDNWDTRVTVQPQRYPDKTEPKQEIAECAILYSNEAWFINACPHSIEVRFYSRGDSSVRYIAPGDTVLLGNVVQAQFFQDPLIGSRLVCSSEKRKRRDKNIRYETRFSTFTPEGHTKRKYYYHILAVLK